MSIDVIAINPLDSVRLEAVEDLRVRVTEAIVWCGLNVGVLS